jgi:hypothetical protein
VDGGLEDLVRDTGVTAIVGDILKIRAHGVGLGDVAVVEMPDAEQVARADHPARRRRGFAAGIRRRQRALHSGNGALSRAPDDVVPRPSIRLG